MYIKDKLKHYYREGNERSVEYILSRYLLMNFQTVPELGLTDISIETGISKASISRFIKTLTLGGNYALFINTVRLEIQTPLMNIKNVKGNIQQIEQELPSIKDHINEQQINDLVDSISKHQVVYLLGETMMQIKLSILNDYIISLHKDIKIMDNFEVLSSLSEDEMAIIVAPEWSIYDFLIQSSLSADVRLDVSNLHGEIYFIANSRKSEQFFKVITLKNYKNEMLNHLVLEYIGYLTVSKLIQKEGAV